MPDEVPPSSGSAWTDEDVEEARRKANRRSALLAFLVFVIGGLLFLADHLASRQPPGLPAIITACYMGAGAAFIVGFFVFFAAMSAWLNLVQRRGGREPEQNDLI